MKGPTERASVPANSYLTVSTSRPRNRTVSTACGWCHRRATVAVRDWTRGHDHTCADFALRRGCGRQDSPRERFLLEAALVRHRGGSPPGPDTNSPHAVRHPIRGVRSRPGPPLAEGHGHLDRARVASCRCAAGRCLRQDAPRPRILGPSQRVLAGAALHRHRCSQVRRAGAASLLHRLVGRPSGVPGDAGDRDVQVRDSEGPSVH